MSDEFTEGRQVRSYTKGGIIRKVPRRYDPVDMWNEMKSMVITLESGSGGLMPWIRIIDAHNDIHYVNATLVDEIEFV